MGNGKSGFNCENNLCAYWTWFNRNKIKCGFPDKIIIGYNGCKSFKPGVYYYINETWKAMGNSNFIPLNNLSYTKDVAIGCFLISVIFPVGFCTENHGGWDWLHFYDETDEEKTPLYRNNFPEKVDAKKFLEYNEIALTEGLDKYFYKDFKKAEEIVKAERKKEEENTLRYPPRYGWLSPTGEFFEGEFGEHEALARKISDTKIEKHAFLFANRKRRENGEVEFNTVGDFLVDRGWVLIDNPLRYGVDKVTYNYEKCLTKAQKEYLYDYFYNRGEKERAKTFLEDNV